MLETVDTLTDTLLKLPPLLRPKKVCTDVMPMSVTRLYDLRKRGLLEFTYVDGMPYVVTSSLLKLIAESHKDPAQANIDAAARARAGKTRPSKRRRAGSSSA
jgi:hypothetical protein